MVADQKTMILLKRFSGNPEVEKARAEFESAQKVEESFHKDFDGQEFTTWSNSPLVGLAEFNSPLI
jgi:hypothetical protein